VDCKSSKNVSSKHQIPKLKQIWNLRFIGNLVLEIWDFIDEQILLEHIIPSLAGHLKITIISVRATL